VRQDQGTAHRVPETVGNPDVALAVHGHPADAITSIKLLHLGRIVGREPGYPIATAICDPDAVLLVNRDTEGGEQVAGIIQRIAGMIYKEELHLVRISLGQVDDLGVPDVERPDITVGRDNDALHLAQPATKGIAARWGERFAGLVELHNRPAAVGGRPAVVLRVNGEAKTDAFRPAAGNPEVWGDRALPFGANLERLPVHNASWFWAPTMKLSPTQNVPLAVHHHFAGGNQSAAREFQRQHPGARRPGEVRHEGRWPQVLALRDRIEIVQQREDFFGLMPLGTRPGARAGSPSLKEDFFKGKRL
jgi:hypothetical protein